MELDPNSENIAAITQSSAGSDCKYTRFDRRNLLTQSFFLASLMSFELNFLLWIKSHLPDYHLS